MSCTVFISHATTDKAIAEALVVLFETGIGIPAEEVFCTSLEGLGIPSGKNFVEFIRGEIEEPKAVVLLLSPAYFESQFCLCELGASWVLGHQVIPLIVPPLDYSDIQAVLIGAQDLKIDNEQHLTQMRQDLVDATGIEPKIVALWEGARRRFLEGLSNVMPDYASDVPVERDVFDKLKEQYDEAVSAISELQVELNDANSQMQRIVAAKTAEEVKEIVAEDADEVEAFEQLVDAASSALAALPKIVQEALYYDSLGQFLPWPQWDDGEQQEITRQIEDGLLVDREGEGIEIEADDPQVKAAKDALSDLSEFVEGCPKGSMAYDQYLQEYGHPLKFTSKRFWKARLFD